MSFLANAFGGGSSAPQIKYTPQGFTNPTGYSISGNNTVSESPNLSSNINGILGATGGTVASLGGLLNTVQPGFSQFRQAGVNAINNAFSAQQSNLQDTLARRRILGSSFANSAFSQSTADQAQTLANFEASSYLQELQSSYNLIQAQYTTATNGYSAAINQSNIESSVAASLTASNNATAAQIASANAELQAKAQQGAGSFLGTLLGVGANAFGGKGLFSSGGIFGGSGAGSDIGTTAATFNQGTSAMLADLGDVLAA